MAEHATSGGDRERRWRGFVENQGRLTVFKVYTKAWNGCPGSKGQETYKAHNGC